MGGSKRGAGGSGPPPENHKNIKFLSKTCLDPHLNGVSLAGRWWSAYSGIRILCSPPKKLCQCWTPSGLWQNFLDPRMSLLSKGHISCFLFEILLNVNQTHVHGCSSYIILVWALLLTGYAWRKDWRASTLQCVSSTFLVQSLFPDLSQRFNLYLFSFNLNYLVRRRILVQRQV